MLAFLALSFEFEPGVCVWKACETFNLKPCEAHVPAITDALRMADLIGKFFVLLQGVSMLDCFIHFPINFGFY